VKKKKPSKKRGFSRWGNRNTKKVTTKFKESANRVCDADRGKEIPEKEKKKKHSVGGMGPGQP